MVIQTHWSCDGKQDAQEVAYLVDDLECPHSQRRGLMVPLIYTDPLKAGKKNPIWGVWRKPKLYNDPSWGIPTLHKSLHLLWCTVSLVLYIILSQLPFCQNSLWHSTPWRVEAGNICTDQLARESINDNIAHYTSHPPIWIGWSALQGNNKTRAKQCWKSLFQPEIPWDQMVLLNYKIRALHCGWKSICSCMIQKKSDELF